MARVAYVMLAHEEPDQVADHVEIITAADRSARVFVHYDAGSPAAEFDKLAGRLAVHSGAVLVAERARGGWGEFGLVQGPLNALREIARTGVDPDYVYLISGSCLPIRPLAELNRFLDERRGAEFIQTQDESWMLAGLREERYRFYFPLSFKKHRRLFNWLVRAQRWLGVRRNPPDGLIPRFGSQWWCLTWTTCRAILAYIDAHPEVVRFFRSTWIPDESFFQTLVYRLADRSSLADRSLTLNQFTAKGKPVVFFDEHDRWLSGQNFFFARKIAAEASLLKRTLTTRAAETDTGQPFGDIGRPTPFYAAEIWARGRREKPGQMFRPDRRRESAPGALAHNTRPYLMLFGPGSATRIAARSLRASGLPVLGRLFHPHRVGFGDHGVDLPGLLQSDMAIRDFDPALYLCRVLDRAPALPVIEQGTFDSARAAMLAFEDPNCLFAFCLPRLDLFGLPPDWDSSAWRLFLALSLFDAANAARIAPDAAWVRQIETIADDALWDFEIKRLTEACGNPDIVEWLKRTAFAEAQKPNRLVLSFGGGRAAFGVPSADVSQIAARWRYVAGFDSRAFETAAAALRDAEVAGPEFAAPPEIRKMLAHLLERAAPLPTARPHPELVPVAARRS